MVQLVPVSMVRPLRAAVLRPGRPASEAIFPGDEDPEAAHAAVLDLDGASALAVGSVIPEPPPIEAVPGRRGWRIRGMAVEPSLRNKGLGRLVLDELLAHVARHDPQPDVWCNARTAALSFYRRAGFQEMSPVVDLPGIGPHVTMRLSEWAPRAACANL